MTEVWKSIPSCPGYVASNLGLIKAAVPRFKTNKRGDGSGSNSGRGYMSVTLQLGGRPVKRFVHRLVCEAFHGPAPSKRHQAAHSNGIRSDNRSDNLSWKTQKENELDKRSHGSFIFGDEHPNTKLSDADVVVVRRLCAVGMNHSAVAKQFNVSSTLIRKISHFQARTVSKGTSA